MSAGPPGTAARWAFGVAAVALIVVGVATAVFVTALAIGGQDAVSDNWVGYLVGIAGFGGLVAALVAFVLALTARRDRGWARLRLPLLLFPVLVASVVLLELFVME